MIRKRSILHDKIGDEITNPNLTIADNPLLEKGMGSAKSDGEGTASVKTDLVEDGILKSFMSRALVISIMFPLNAIYTTGFVPNKCCPF